MLGILFSLAAALSFSGSDVSVRRGTRFGSGSQAAFVTVMVGVPLFLVACLATGQLFHFDRIGTKGYAFLIAAGLIHYFIGRVFNYGAIRIIGATRNAPFQAMNLPYSIAVAWIFLGEGVSAGMMVGIALIMAGPLLLVERGGAASTVVSKSETPATDQPPLSPSTQAAVPAVAIPAAKTSELRLAEGYALAVAGAACYGSSPVLIRAALEHTSGVSIFGGLVSYLAAATALLVLLVLPSRRELVRSMHPNALKAFTVGGVSVFFAQMFRFVALSLAPVAIVATLIRFSSVFTLGLSWLINRDLERINQRVILGILISVTGAVLLVVAS
ncbi:MAG TPA: DMT family transporter [Dehalococcoidia bacterium]|nr:DMT family transporter [Dehalococcoidia bacterium]